MPPILTLDSLSVQFSSVAQSCPSLCDPMNRSTPGLPVHHQFLEFTQTHVHRVGDAIQPSHPLLSPSPPAPNPSQHQSLFQWVNSWHEVAKVLEFSASTSVFPMNTQDWSPLEWTCVPQPSHPLKSFNWVKLNEVSNKEDNYRIPSTGRGSQPIDPQPAVCRSPWRMLSLVGVRVDTVDAEEGVADDRLSVGTVEAGAMSPRWTRTLQATVSPTILERHEFSTIWRLEVYVNFILTLKGKNTSDDTR